MQHIISWLEMSRWIIFIISIIYKIMFLSNSLIIQFSSNNLPKFWPKFLHALEICEIILISFYWQKTCDHDRPILTYANNRLVQKIWADCVLLPLVEFLRLSLIFVKLAPRIFNNPQHKSVFFFGVLILAGGRWAFSSFHISLAFHYLSFPWETKKKYMLINVQPSLKDYNSQKYLVLTLSQCPCDPIF